jgi:hypothetical protein
MEGLLKVSIGATNHLLGNANALCNTQPYGLTLRRNASPSRDPVFRQFSTALVLFRENYSNKNLLQTVTLSEFEFARTRNDGVFRLEFCVG